MIYLFDAGVWKYRFDAQCSFMYSLPFSSYSAFVILLVVSKGDKANFLAPDQASRMGLSENMFTNWKTFMFKALMYYFLNV